MALGAILGGIAASPFRAAGGIAKGTAKLGYAGVKGLAISAADVSGAAPLFAAALGIGKGIKAGYKKGKELLRPWGTEPGGVSEDSALAAIAAAASETAKIQAETAKIEAETDALKGGKVEPKTTMGGIDVEILEKIYGETVSIREILGGTDPESEKKELALDEQVRHKKFLKALAALGFDGGKDDKRGFELPDWLSNLLPIFKGILAGIIGALGLVALAKYWPQIEKMVDLIKDAFTNINEFITDLQTFWETMDMSMAGLLGNIMGMRAGMNLVNKTRTGPNRARTSLPPKVIPPKPIDEKGPRTRFLEWIGKRREAFRKWILLKRSSFRAMARGVGTTITESLTKHKTTLIEGIKKAGADAAKVVRNVRTTLSGEILTRIDAAKESFKESLRRMDMRSGAFAQTCRDSKNKL